MFSVRVGRFTEINRIAILSLRFDSRYATSLFRFGSVISSPFGHQVSLAFVFNFYLLFFFKIRIAIVIKQSFYCGLAAIDSKLST